MMLLIVRFLGVLMVFFTSISADNLIEEKDEWHRCLNIKSDQKRKACIVDFEKKFYPNAVYSDDELHWSDISWVKRS